MKALIALLLASVALAAPAQDIKIGFVRTEVIQREAEVAKQAKARLDAEFLKRENDLNAQLAQRNAEANALDKEAPTLSDSERNRRRNAIYDKDRFLERKKREYQEDRTQRQNEEMMSLIERMRRAVQHVAESEHYDLILADDAAAYASDRIDITKRVIAVMNAQK